MTWNFCCLCPLPKLTAETWSAFKRVCTWQNEACLSRDIWSRGAQWSGVNGLAYDLCPICLLYSLFLYNICIVLNQANEQKRFYKIQVMNFLELRQSKVHIFSPELLNICNFWTTAVSIFPQCTMQKQKCLRDLGLSENISGPDSEVNNGANP